MDVEFKAGIINHFHAYVQRVSHDAIVVKNGRMYVPQSLNTKEYISTYLYKIPRMDYSAKDCAFLAIDHVGVPSEEEMSIDSIEKFIRVIFAKDYKDKA